MPPRRRRGATRPRVPRLRTSGRRRSAPPGARATARAIHRLVRRVGIEQAADLTQRSPRTLQRVVEAAEGRRPLRDVIPSPQSLERWQRHVAEARVATRRTMTLRAFGRLRAREPDFGWHRTLYSFRSLQEAQRRAADFVRAGVPESELRIVGTPGRWYIARPREYAGRRGRR